LNEDGDLQKFMSWLWEECRGQRLQYVELRPLSEIREAGLGLLPGLSYWYHELNLGQSPGMIFRRMHKNSIQRKIHRAERESLSYESGTSEQLVDEFYGLLLMTRRRHKLFPQPRAWFRNLVQCMGDGIQIRLARKDGTPIAAILTLQHRSSVIFKYGCSDARFHNLGGMPFLFWRLVEESVASGTERVDFGRSDLDNVGLIAFKDRLGTTRKLLKYYRYTSKSNGKAAAGWRSRGLGRLIRVLPDIVLSAAGRAIYKHMG
jgi:CelD/BcsL family acetyltransferase involved in cellulose biosynthesis